MTAAGTGYSGRCGLWFAKIADGIQIKELADPPRLRVCPYDTDFMLCLLRSLVVLLIRVFGSRRDLLLENLALRQQLVVLKQRNPRPLVSTSDKLFWVILRRLWPEWKRALIIVQPETVVRWHRAGFKLYWKWLSRPRLRAGRKCVSKELRELIFRMAAENSTWGAPRIHGELKMLGFDLSERTVLRWMRRAPRSPEPAQRWAAFLSNHREAHHGVYATCRYPPSDHRSRFSLGSGRRSYSLLGG